MKVGVIGATGYTGFELVKLLAAHPKFEIAALTSDSSAGVPYSSIYPELKSLADNIIVANNFNDVAENVDAVFLCLPHGASIEAAAFFYDKNKIVVDLSADFRVSEQNIYNNVYNITHSRPDLLKEAVYGIPELFYDKVKCSRLVANPGCYPTSIIMPLYPLLKEKLISTEFIIADSKSGVSGAGKKPTEKTHFCEVNEDFKPYGIFSHRHNPEINFILSDISIDNVDVTFMPHLLPINRGIESTIYFRSEYSRDRLFECLSDYYENKRFVRLYDSSKIPSIKGVRYSNFIDIGIYKKGDRCAVVSCIDNLLKGASGQALQNLNVIAGYSEDCGIL